MRWRPDTCGCVLDVTDDMSRATSVVACSVHRGQSTGRVFAAVRRENTLKNQAHAIVLEQSELAEDVEVEGSTVRRLRSGVEFEWGFDKDRTLDVDVKGASESGRARLESQLTLSLPNMVRVRRG